MARKSEGPKLRPKRNPNDPTEIRTCRFAIRGTQHEFSTGECDEGKAQQEAHLAYVAALRGVARVKGTVAVSDHAREKVSEMFVAFFLAKGHLLSVDCRKSYMTSARRLGEVFDRVADITDASLADYRDKRLGRVQKDTVLHDIDCLFAMLTWSKEKGLLAEIPERPKFGKKGKQATGTRATTVTMRMRDGQIKEVKRAQKEKPNKFSESECLRLVAELPEFSAKAANGTGVGGPRMHIRRFYAVKWESGLRDVTIDKIEIGRHFNGTRRLSITADMDKNEYARVIPITEECQRILQEVVGGRTSGRVFAYGEPTVNRKTRHRYFEAAAERAKLPNPGTVSANDLRHSRATDIMRKSRNNILGLCELMGWTDITRANTYVEANRDADDVPGFGGDSGEVPLAAE